MGEITDALTRASEDPARSRNLGAMPRGEPARVVPARGHLQTISREIAGDWVARVVLSRPESYATEQYRQLALRVHRALVAAKQRSVLLTSATRGEGKSTAACNLALALAGLKPEQRVLLAELDLRGPSIAANLGLRVERGVDDILASGASWSEAVIPTDIANLDVIAARRPVGEIASLLSGRSFHALWRMVQEHYDFVIVDGPPALGLSDPSILLGLVDRYLVIARARMSRLHAVQELLATLPEGKVLGVLMNGTPTPRQIRSSEHRGYYAQRATNEQPS